MGTVFIGIPTRNRPLLVQDTVRSVLCQTHQDYRVIVSDNQSEAGTSRAVESFINELNDDRFSFYRQEENVGEYGQGRYFFQESANYRYLMILHDDDVLRPDYLAKALDSLEPRRSVALFVANPYLMDLQGRSSSRMTGSYLADHGRIGRAGGEFDVLSAHLANGFTPISGTLFRRSALAASGFVDDDCHGNFPFECNIFLRLGDCGAKGWFSTEELLGFRFHSASLRNSGLMHDRLVVDTMIRLYERRRFGGWMEQRRRATLSRLYRAKSLILLRHHEDRDARQWLARALHENPWSLRAWAVAPPLLLLPWSLRRLLPTLPEPWEPPHAAVSGIGSSIRAKELVVR